MYVSQKAIQLLLAAKSQLYKVILQCIITPYTTDGRSCERMGHVLRQLLTSFGFLWQPSTSHFVRTLHHAFL